MKLFIITYQNKNGFNQTFIRAETPKEAITQFHIYSLGKVTGIKEAPREKHYEKMKELMEE